MIRAPHELPRAVAGEMAAVVAAVAAEAAIRRIGRGRTMEGVASTIGSTAAATTGTDTRAAGTAATLERAKGPAEMETAAGSHERLILRRGSIPRAAVAVIIPPRAVDFPHYRPGKIREAWGGSIGRTFVAGVRR